MNLEDILVRIVVGTNRSMRFFFSKFRFFFRVDLNSPWELNNWLTEIFFKNFIFRIYWIIRAKRSNEIFFLGIGIIVASFELFPLDSFGLLHFKIMNDGCVSERLNLIKLPVISIGNEHGSCFSARRTIGWWIFSNIYSENNLWKQAIS